MVQYNRCYVVQTFVVTGEKSDIFVYVGGT